MPCKRTRVLIGPQVVHWDLTPVREAAGAAAEFVLARTPQAVEELISGADVVYGIHPTSDLLRRASSLQWWHVTSAGVNAFPLCAFAERGIFLTNSSGVFPDAVADHAMALLLGLTRGLCVLVRRQQQRVWEKEFLLDLRGRTMVIVGLGNIGRAVGRRAKAFGMKTIGVRRRAKPARWADRVVGSEELHSFLPQAEVLVVTCPLTEATRGLLGRAELALLPPRAYLINVARGGIVDETALIEALQQGSLAGAGLDCFEREPLPPDSPLWDVENCIITPHCAGGAYNHPDEALGFFAEQLRLFLAGKRLKNIIRAELGY